MQKEAPKKPEEVTSEPIKAKEEESKSTIQPTVEKVIQVEHKVEPANVLGLQKSRTREEWEAFIGGKLLNRIGALALIIGLGFFLKYAFDNNWISETVRVLIGAVVGLLCLGFAHYTNKKGFQVFAQGLVGAGIAILYLSVYASFNFYSLLPQWIAFILMSIVTAMSLSIGLFYNSLAVGILGWAGGFLTPVMLSTGTANEIGLFTYIALLDVGLLAVVFAKKEWNVLEPLTLVGTWVIFFGWYFNYYNESDLVITVFFISVFWILFFGLDYARLRLTKEVVGPIQHMLAGVNLILYYIMLYALIDAEYHSWMGGITILIACIYFGIFLLLKYQGVNVEIVTIRYALSTIVLAVIATAIQFEDFMTITLWSVEVILLMWCAVRWDKKFITIAATALFALTSLKFFYTDGAFEYLLSKFTPFFNERCLALVSIALAGGTSSFLLKKFRPNIDKALLGMFNVAWIVALFILFTAETNDIFRLQMQESDSQIISTLNFIRPLVLAIIWSVFSILLVWISINTIDRAIFLSSLSILFLAMCFTAVAGFEFKPISDFQLGLNLRVGLMLTVIIGVLTYQQFVRKFKDQISWIATIANVLRVGIIVLIFIILTGETIDYFQKQIVLDNPAGEEYLRISNLRQLSLSGIWLVYSVALMVFGFWHSLRNFRIIAFVLFGFTILKIFIYDLSYLQTLYRIFSFIGLGIMLITVSLLYQKYKDIIFGNK